MADYPFPAAELEDASLFLRRLLQIDTSNPPGKEREATAVVEAWCKRIELPPILTGVSPDRPNLTARWEAEATNRTSRPLLLSCHLDVVPANPQDWTHPPFSGHDDGTTIWGRGAIDMKGFAVMALASLARLRRAGIVLKRDVIFVAAADEEAGTRLGSRWLVENRPDLLGGNPEYVINEVGGFTVHRKGRRFYPIQVAEKGVAWIRLTAKGRSGHSSLPSKDSSVARLGSAIRAISEAQLPWHPSPEALRFIEGFARPDTWIARKVAPLLAHPRIGPRLLPLAVSEPSRRLSLEALLRNTANPTCLRSGSATNVLPDEVSVDIDGRLAPGQSGEDLIRELMSILPAELLPHLHWETLHENGASSFSTDTDLYREMERTLLEADPGSHVVPSMIPGFTDSQNYARLGAQCYGFYPLRLPPELDFAALFHGVDERVPIDGFHWGIRTLTDMLRRFLAR